MDGNQLADIITRYGYKVKSKTKTSVVVLVTGNRIEKMKDLNTALRNLGAKIDSNLKGSSIGGIVVGNVKVILKADGKTGGLDVEAKAIEDLYDAVMIALLMTGGPISIRMKGKTVPGIVDVVKTAGTPKSDFHLAGENGKPLIHISHKKGSTPRDFQQWGGVTEDRIAKHPEVIKFGNLCLAEFGPVMGSGLSAWMPIKDKSLKMMSVFGVNFDAGGINENKVDVLIQGDPGLRQISDGVFELTGTGHVHYHGELPDGGFEPVLAMIYKGDRSQFGVKGGRASIYPMGGRTFKKKL